MCGGGGAEKVNVMPSPLNITCTCTHSYLPDFDMPVEESEDDSELMSLIVAGESMSVSITVQSGVGGKLGWV